MPRGPTDVVLIRRHHCVTVICEELSDRHNHRDWVLARHSRTHATTLARVPDRAQIITVAPRWDVPTGRFLHRKFRQIDRDIPFP